MWEYRTVFFLCLMLVNWAMMLFGFFFND